MIEYININSNHPRHVLKNTVAEVAKRLSTLSSSKEIFDATKGPEQEALRRAGYMEELTYQPEVTATPRRRQRKRKVVWFNPPYCMSLKTKVGQRFLNILDSCFPTDHPLHRVFNRHTVQLSYRTMPNLAKIISGHNALPEQYIYTYIYIAKRSQITITLFLYLQFHMAFYDHNHQEY